MGMKMPKRADGRGELHERGGRRRRRRTEQLLHAELEDVGAVRGDRKGLGQRGLTGRGERTAREDGRDHAGGQRGRRAQRADTCSRCRRDGRQREPEVCAPALGGAVPCHYLSFRTDGPAGRPAGGREARVGGLRAVSGL